MGERFAYVSGDGDGLVESDRDKHCAHYLEGFPTGNCQRDVIGVGSFMAINRRSDSDWAIHPHRERGGVNLPRVAH